MTVIARQCVKSSTFQFHLSFILDNYQRKRRAQKVVLLVLNVESLKRKGRRSGVVVRLLVLGDRQIRKITVQDARMKQLSIIEVEF